ARSCAPRRAGAFDQGKEARDRSRQGSMNALVYVLRGCALGLSWLLALNVAASALMVYAARRTASSNRAHAPVFWLALRLLPSVVSFAFVLFVFVPSYLRYEPMERGESFDVTLSALAVAAAALILTAAARGAGAWRAALRRTTAWKRIARPLPLEGTSLPVFAVEMAAPVMALAGVFRPRLLITRGVLD